MTRCASTSALLVLLLAGCGGERAGGDDTGGDDDARPIDGGPPPPPDAARDPVVRFVALGDTGEGSVDQRRVAIAMRDRCAADGCDFALLLGDNIYDDGPTSTTDVQWQTKFEEPYADVDLPFYAVLGNHDYGTLANDWPRGQYQIDYGVDNPDWMECRTTGTHFALRVRRHAVLRDGHPADDVGPRDRRAGAVVRPRRWWPSTARWKVGFGHHPYISNGSHGNAGNYEGIPGIDFISGAVVKEFIDTRVCEQIDVYFSGHDHSRQWLDEPTALCGTQMIVTGAGAKTTDILERGNAAFFQDATKPGFVYVVIDGDTFTGRFYDADGNLDYERSFTKK